MDLAEDLNYELHREARKTLTHLWKCGLVQGKNGAIYSQKYSESESESELESDDEESEEEVVVTSAMTAATTTRTQEDQEPSPTTIPS